MTEVSGFDKYADVCTDIWNAFPEDDPAPFSQVYQRLSVHLGSHLAVGYFDVTAHETEEWVRHTLHPIPVLHDHECIESLFADGSLGDLQAWDLFQNYGIPRLSACIESGEPSQAFFKFKWHGYIVGLDSLYLPQRSKSAPEWIIFLSGLRFMLKEAPGLELEPVDASIIQFLIEGKTAKEIAIALAMNHRAIEYRITRMKEETGARNTIQLIAMMVGQQVEDAMFDYQGPPLGSGDSTSADNGFRETG